MGDIYKHYYWRTVIETGNVWAMKVTMNLNLKHINEPNATEIEFGQRLVDRAFWSRSRSA